MGKSLMITEKASVARDVAAVLGGFSKNADGTFESVSTVIVPARGHLVQMTVRKDEDRGWELSALPCIPARFALEPLEKTKAELSLISKHLKRDDVSSVINACDAGREGELIFRLIYMCLGCKKPFSRMWLRSMTADSIREAYAHQRSATEMESLGQAAMCRSEADWLVGINGTRALTKYREMLGKTDGVTSVGRVQTVVLAMLYDREMDIRNFVPRNYYEVHGTFRAIAGTYDGKWFDPSFKKGGEGEQEDRVFDPEKAKDIERRCSGVNPSSVVDESTPSTSMPPALFDLTTLQREANVKFGFSAKMTLDLAQTLYDTHKVLSYPRTDASALPEDYLEKTKQTLATYGDTVYEEHAQRVLGNNWVRQEKRIFDNNKISDHFAIIPTGDKPRSLSVDESKIYDMVVRRFIAVFHPAAEYLKTTRISVVAGESFKSKGSVLVTPGWLLVYGRDGVGDADSKMCRVQPGEQVVTESVKAVGMTTKPPERYTEATLLGAMENAGRLVDDEDHKDAMKGRGIGTPATRAATIEEMLSAGRCYAKRDKKYLVPMEKAMEVIHFLRTNGVEALTSPQMTGEWEFKLGQIEQGTYARAAFMAEARAMTTRIVDQIRAKAKSTPGAQVTVLDVPCPKCKGSIHGAGKMFSCQACAFKMWREVARRVLSKEEAEQLVKTRSTDVLDGLISGKGAVFSAKLVFDDAYSKVTFEFDNATSAPPAQREVVGKCPKCQGDVLANGDNFDCEKSFDAKTCDFRLWGTVAQLKLSRATVSTLLEHGRTGLLSGLKSPKTKKTFSAHLVLNAVGKVEFEFEKRQ